MELRQPTHERAQRVGAQLSEQLAEVFFRRMARRLIQGLEQLRQRVGLGQPSRQRFENLTMLRNQLAGALENDLALAQDEGDRAKIARAQQVRDEVFENRDELGTNGAVRLQLEQIEQHREHVTAQVLRVFALDFLVQVTDFIVVEEIEGRVEVIDRD